MIGKIYQTFAVHNRPWTMREILFFGVLFIAVTVVFSLLTTRKKIGHSQALAAEFLFVYLVFVLATTVFTRESTGTYTYRLLPFWSWYEVVHGSRELLVENLMNVLLLFPAGMLLPLVFRKRFAWYQGFLIGFIFSCGIEVAQLVLCRGLFEWDDMIHNGIGVMCGCVLMGKLAQKIGNFS